ncbi:MAG: 2-oxoacid:acceptor oxidoreductase family protein [Desulfobacterales bacterium]|nr:2-oxoacid:acceptor oxidoreductase family protein [Desulfobacterales bacterium]
MLVKMLFAGSGGQGVLTIAEILGNAAMLEDYNVTYLPAYGAAMRGGTANCTLSISDIEIASPITSTPDILISMNQPSVLAFINSIRSGGQLIYNSAIVDTIPPRRDIDIFPVPANEIAMEISNPRSANMIILASAVKLINIIKIETVYKSVEMLMGSKKKAVESVIKALAEGYARFSFNNPVVNFF